MIIAQISDVHIECGSRAPERELVMADAARQAVEHLNRLPAVPDAVIITGDCTNNGTASEYQRFRELFQPLTMPYYVIPGNHDNREQMLAAFGTQGSAPLDGFVQYTVEGGPVRLIALDTNIPGAGGGELCQKRLSWLEQRLAEAPDQPTLIFMHHPPFDTGWQPLDKIGFATSEALSAIVARHPQVERIVAGHSHTHSARRFAGTVAMICSATHQGLFVDESQPERFAGTRQPPLCLIHVWRAGAGLHTHTSAIGAHAPLVVLHDGQDWVG